MNTRKFLPCFFFITLLVGNILSAQLTHADISQEERAETYKQLEIFSNVLSILQNNYVEEIDTREVLNGAIKGLLLSLDPHSSYLPPEELRELQEETQGAFSGIGIEVTIKDDLLTVVSPIADTPADKAGLKANDVIIEIDGIKTKNMGAYEAIKTSGENQEPLLKSPSTEKAGKNSRRLISKGTSSLCSQLNSRPSLLVLFTAELLISSQIQPQITRQALQKPEKRTRSKVLFLT